MATLCKFTQKDPEGSTGKWGDDGYFLFGALKLSAEGQITYWWRDSQRWYEKKKWKWHKTNASWENIPD